MWPDLFGPGWQWGVLVSFGVLGAFIGILKVLDILSAEPVHHEDPLLALWHRYEVGDLTRQEFERLKPERATYRTPTPGRGPAPSQGIESNRGRVAHAGRPISETREYAEF